MVEAKRHALEHGEPVMVHANCIRIGSHSNSDRHELYRDDFEMNYIREYDPLAKFRRLLLRYGRMTEEEIAGIESEAKQIVKDAHKKVLASPDPDPASIFDHVYPKAYQPEKYTTGLPDGTGRKLRLIEALNETMKAEFRHHPDTFIWGQDIASKEKEGSSTSPRACSRNLEGRGFSMRRSPRITSLPRPTA